MVPLGLEPDDIHFLGPCRVDMTPSKDKVEDKFLRESGQFIKIIEEKMVEKKPIVSDITRWGLRKKGAPGMTTEVIVMDAHRASTLLAQYNR